MSSEVRMRGMSWWSWGPLAFFGIGANLWILWYLLFHFPSECVRLAILSGGTVICGLEPGAYMFIAVAVMLLAAQLYTLVKWTFEGI